MLPPRMIGDKTRNLLLGRIALFAIGPANRTLITPLVTSTLDTYLHQLEVLFARPAD